MSYIGAEPTTAAFPFDQFSGNGSTTAFTLTYAPASTTSIMVAISGVVQNPNLYSVVGTTLTFSPAPPSGTNNIAVLYLGLPVIGSGSPGNTAFLSATDLTATAGQTVFASAGSYTPGFVQVFRNGARLGNADFTATNGTTITLANAATAGDLVTIEYYTLTSLTNALPLTGGTVTGSVTIQGLTVGRGAGAVATNTAVGASALAATATGGFNTGMGANSLKVLTSGTTNTATGHNSLQANTTGSSNAAFGQGALELNTTGGNNTALGYNALSVNTTASNNTAVGYQAGYSTTTAGANIAIGYQALYSNTTGQLNVAIGSQALYAQSADAYNTAVGGNSMQSTTTGSQNAALGRLSLNANTTGSNNTAVGYQALTANTTASNNTAVGHVAGTAITTGTNNVMIGYSSGSSSSVDITTGSNNICIGGNRPSASAATGTHQIVLATAANISGKGNDTGFISPNGGGVYQGNNSSSWSTTSDQRLKKNIVDNNDGLGKITAIQVRNFEYRLPEEVDAELAPTDAIKKSGVQLGVIAQELQQVLPECVKTESTGVMSVDTDNLTWYLINAVKELTARVKQLEGN